MKRLIVLLFVMSSLIYSQWVAANFYPLNGSIVEFYMSDTLNITAILEADSCFVVRSYDGGRNWTILNPIALTAAAAVNFLDEQTIIVFGYSGSNGFKTTNSGATWTNFSVPSTFSEVKQIQFFGANDGYALVRKSTGGIKSDSLLRTYDGGVNWVNINLTTSGINRFRFSNLQDGWLCGDKMYHTTDGGGSFTQLNFPSGFSDGWSIDTIADSLIILGGAKWIGGFGSSTYAPVIAISRNGGDTWSVRDFSLTTIRGIASDIKLLNDTTALTILETGRGILMTTDLGQNWSTGDYPEKFYSGTDIEIMNNKVFVSGVGSVFLASNENIVEPWDLRLEQTYQNPRGFDFLDPGYVIIGNNSSYSSHHKIYISSDRGENWRTEYFPFFTPMNLEIVSDTLVYLASTTEIYKTDVICKNYQWYASLPLEFIMDIEVSPNGNFWLCSNNKLISSSDDGQTWVTKFSPGGEYFRMIKMFSDGTGYAANGKVYKTTNHGDTWVQLGYSLFGVYQFNFYDSNNGFFVGSNQQVYRTHDGGTTVELVSIAEMSGARYVFCSDSLNYHLIANKLFSTYDGGKMWKMNEIPSTGLSSLAGVHMFDHLNGIAIAGGGGRRSIWITNNRGNTPVELSSFTAFPFDNKVMLNWTTETETNNLGFEIERRNKYGDWKKIAFSKGSGTSTRKIYYGYDDYEPKAPAILYYRLKQIDYNGQFEYSKEVEVLLGDVPGNYAINQNYPNPFNPSTKVTFSLPEENKVVIRVFNPMGELVKEIDRGILPHGNFEQDIEMGTQSSGMYFCQVLCTNTVSGRTKSLTIKMALMK
ncbi:MAG: hypothetical protein LCH52_14215 [Bacteroidetes bacterium]|nr:hypothetical protein [Bacteroidota bacterium]